MAKELGQIHSVSAENVYLDATITPPAIPFRYDLCALLSDKLQRMVRQGNFVKLVGVDMALHTADGVNQSATLSGYLRYYAPTRGRCAAFRHAFKAAADQMTMQGIPMRENKNYDFRVALTDQPNFPVLANQATLDGTNGLALNHTSVPGASVLSVYNASVLPNLEDTPPADLFNEGFDTLLQSGGAKTDFVLNETRLYSGNEDTADLSYDRIPFQISMAPNTADGSTTPTFQWRPDPALYVAVMTGNLEIVIEEINIGGAGAADLEVTFYVSGWKSIMGDPDKKKRSRSKRKGRK